MTEPISHDERAALIFDALRREPASAEAADLVLLTDTLARPSAWEVPRPALEDLVVQAVLDAEPTAIAPVTILRASAGLQPRDADTRATPKHRRRRRASLSVAAAVAAIAIAAGVPLARKHHDQPDFTAELTAGARALEARGSADMYKTDGGFRVELDASGLPRLTGTEYYEAWLQNAAGVAVPIGTFSANGGDVILWSGVSPDQFARFSVTIETADNNQSSSRLSVLDGRMHRAREDHP
jgi:anti-sigma-K factor RskA